MPVIDLKHVVSCSSEHAQYPAANLLSPEPHKKWKCAQPGEKQAVVVLQFEKASPINSVHIGNEGSAFVELLVGRSAETTDSFQVLVAASSFMTPEESRQGKNVNRVRMLGLDKLDGKVAAQNWDRLKIVCSQPFITSATYGLSFIRAQAPPDKNAEKPKIQQQQMLGKFMLKPSALDDSGEPAFKPGALFGQKKAAAATAQDAQSPVSQSDRLSELSPALIRSAGREFLERAERKLTARSPVRRQSPEAEATPKGSANDSKTAARKRVLRDESKDKEDSGPRKKLLKTPPSNGVGKEESVARKKLVKTPSTKDASPKRSNRKPRKKPKPKLVPLNALLKGVTFVLSGFTNPLRSQLRDKGLSLGAVYKPEWDPSCTHLVCAFSNTPKAGQAKKDGGRIVKKGWLLECHKQGRRLSWKQYAFESNPEGSSSEEDILVGVEDVEESAAAEKPSTPVVAEETSEQHNSSFGTIEVNSSSGNDSVYNLSTDNQSGSSSDEGNGQSESSSGSGDTEDEIERIKARRRQRRGKKQPIREEKRLPIGEDGLPMLPDYFKDHSFLLYGSFDAVLRRQIGRFVVAYGGTVSPYMGDGVTHIVKDGRWDSECTAVRQENPKISFVTSDWILDCGKTGKLPPIEEYLIKET